MVSLILFVLVCDFSHKVIRRRLLLALSFSLLGDVALLFSGSRSFFISGLTFFLLAHLSYLSIFYRELRSDEISGSDRLRIAVPFLIYALIVFLMIGQSLGDLLFAVVLYMFVILAMAVAALLRKDFVSDPGFRAVSAGALLFVISDTLLSLNLFYNSFPAAGFLVMSTYALAQFFIVTGLFTEYGVTKKGHPD